MPRTFDFRYDDLAQVLRAKLEAVRRAQQARGARLGSNETSGRLSEGAQDNVSADDASSRQQARRMRR